MVQNGPNPHLNIVDIAGKGQGVVAGAELRAGQFVCEYAGEVMIIMIVMSDDENNNDHVDRY